MTDEEKAEEYLRCKWECGSYDRNDKRCLYKNKCIKYQIYFDGLAEGRKEVREHETTCVNRLHHVEKENAELKAQIEEREKLIEIQYAENQTLGNNNATLIHRLGELSEQIEKMKCCENCEHCGSDEAIGENGDYSDYTCIQCDDLSTKEKPYPNWRLAE